MEVQSRTNNVATTTASDSSTIWLFDSVCVLCSWSVRLTLRYEISPLIKFVSIQSTEGRGIAILNGIDPDNPESFLYLEGGQVLAKSDGVFALAKHLKYPLKLVRLGRFMPKFIRDKAYDIIAQNRYKLFGRLDACIVPGEEARDRFVL